MVASKFRLMRVARGLTQQKLADLTAGVVSQVTISQIEHGRRACPEEKAVLSAILGAPPEELFDDR